jgi:hypothetical protein
MKKRFSVFAAVLILCSCLLPACAKNSAADAELLNGFDGYSDLLRMTFREMAGSVKVNTDAAYVTQGGASARVVLDYNQEGISFNGFGVAEPYGPEAQNTAITFEAAAYGGRISDLSAIEAFELDVYSLSDGLDAYFSAFDQNYNYLFSDGAPLAKGWNYLRFKVKPWFCADAADAYGFELVINGAAGLPDKRAVLYLDNFRAKKAAADAGLPERGRSGLSFNGLTLLDCKEEGDESWVLARNAPARYDWSMTELQSLFYVGYDAGFRDGGALRVSIDRSNRDGELWQGDRGYDIVLHPSLYGRLSAASSASVTLYNGGGETLFVALVAKKGNKTLRQDAVLPVFGSVTITLQLGSQNALDTVNSLLLRFDSWRIAGKTAVWLGGFRYDAE